MIRVGTCSWTDKSLLKSGEFYPGDVKTAEGRLRFYASHFQAVEVDSSYYAIPDKRNTYLWIDRTPKDFIFHIKAYGALTGHGIAPKTLPRDIQTLLPEKDKTQKFVYIKEPSVLKAIAERFIEAILPLYHEHRLGVVVFQFPPWFQNKPQNYDYILLCRELMSELSLAVEFRHGSWLTPESITKTLDFLKKSRLTYITADEPQYGTLATVPFHPYATGGTAYFRFHGRNRENWLKKGIETSLRYAYLYSDDELKRFIPHLHQIERDAKVTYAMFNNCHGGFAMKNALRMKQLVGEQQDTDG